MINDIVKRYTVAFLFAPDLLSVWMVTKLRPAWQAGALNGIGGKLEPGEHPDDGIVREIKEETAAEFTRDQLDYVGYMHGTNNDGAKFLVYIYTATTIQKLEQVEDEPIELVNVNAVKMVRHVGNVPALIELCRYKIGASSAFSKIIMEY